MKVQVKQNPKNVKGLGINWAINWSNIKQETGTVKQCLGFTFDDKNKMWVSEGPEVLLDMERFNIGIDWMSAEAREICEGFRQQIWDVMDARVQETEGEFGYQLQGTNVLASMPNVILGDDMGLGKSKQSLDAAARIGANFILVLCPKTLCYNWKNEVEKWHPEWSVGVVPDGKKSNPRKGYIGREEFWDVTPNVVIANYEKLLLKDWPFDIEWQVVICDEATRLKTATTATYKAAKKIIKMAGCTWALTGTPLEIKLVELYNILGLLRPSVLGGFTRFRDAHLITDWSGSVVGAQNLELLRERIAPFMLRRTKREVLSQLPQKMPPNNVFVKLSPEEQIAYDHMTSDFNNWLSEQGVSGAGNPLTEMLRMHQFCCTPDLFTEDLGRGSKFEMLQDLVDEWNGLIVIFCSFEQVTKRLWEWLNCHPEAYIAGNVRVEDRFPRIERFNNGELGKVLVSTDAGNQGLNITGADMIIHYDQLWNPQKMKQREDRLHRIGQQKVVVPVNMLCLDTIDVGMYQLNREREHLFEEVVEGAEEAILRKLNAPRLRKIVEGKLNNERVE